MTLIVVEVRILAFKFTHRKNISFSPYTPYVTSRG